MSRLSAEQLYPVQKFSSLLVRNYLLLFLQLNSTSGTKEAGSLHDAENQLHNSTGRALVILGQRFEPDRCLINYTVLQGSLPGVIINAYSPNPGKNTKTFPMFSRKTNPKCKFAVSYIG